MRGHAPFGILQRRAVAKPDEGQELIELAVAVNRQRLPPQLFERQRLGGDDWREDDAHLMRPGLSLRAQQACACARHRAAVTIRDAPLLLDADVDPDTPRPDNAATFCETAILDPEGSTRQIEAVLRERDLKRARQVTWAAT